MLNVRNQQYFLPKPKEVPPAHCVSNFGGKKKRRPSWVLWLSLATGEHLRVQSSPQGQQQTKTETKDMSMMTHMVIPGNQYIIIGSGIRSVRARRSRRTKKDDKRRQESVGYHVPRPRRDPRTNPKTGYLLWSSSSNLRCWPGRGLVQQIIIYVNKSKINSKGF